MMKKLGFLLLLVVLSLFAQAHAHAQSIGGQPVAIIFNQAGLGPGAWFQMPKNVDGVPKVAFQAVESGSGSVTATVTIEVSNDAVNPGATVACTITLSGTAVQADGCTTDMGWGFVRANRFRQHKEEGRSGRNPRKG